MKLREFACALDQKQKEGSLPLLFTSREVANCLGMLDSPKNFNHVIVDLARQFRVGNLIRRKKRQKKREDCLYLYEFSKRGRNYVQWLRDQGLDLTDAQEPSLDAQLIPEIFNFNDNDREVFLLLLDRGVIRVSPSKIVKLLASMGNELNLLADLKKESPML